MIALVFVLWNDVSLIPSLRMTNAREWKSFINPSGAGKPSIDFSFYYRNWIIELTYFIKHFPNKIYINTFIWNKLFQLLVLFGNSILRMILKNAIKMHFLDSTMNRHKTWYLKKFMWKMNVSTFIYITVWNKLKSLPFIVQGVLSTTLIPHIIRKKKLWKFWEIIITQVLSNF